MSLKLGQKTTVEALTVELVEPTLLKLGGTLSTPTAQAEFRKLLLDLHANVVSARAQLFSVDVRELEFVNSSAIRAFVDWISRASHAGYKLAFTTNPAITWHRLSFSVLKSLAADTVELIEDRSPRVESGKPA